MCGRYSDSTNPSDMISVYWCLEVECLPDSAKLFVDTVGYPSFGPMKNSFVFCDLSVCTAHLAISPKLRYPAEDNIKATR
jgi:hypothetical protein